MKKMVFTVLLFLSLVLTGCKSNTTVERDITDYETPSFTVIDTNGVFDYVVDNNTKVVYIRYVAGYGRAITVAYNSDGTIMTEEDIKKK